MKKSKKTEITVEESRRKAEEADLLRRTPLDLGMNMTKFITEAFYRKVSASTGLQLAKKMILDTKGVLMPTESDMGDAFSVSRIIDLITRILYYEIKTSFLNIDHKNFRIDHIRDYQDFDYFLICFVDKLNKYEGLFYILPMDFICKNPSVFSLSAMNNTKRANMNNINIDKKLVVKRDVVYDLFPKYSLIPTTKYKDFLEMLMSYELHNIRSKTILQPFKTKIKFDINGTIIDGNNNREVWGKFVAHLGPMRSEKFFNKFLISVKPSDLRNLQLPLGNHWLDPNISRWEAQRIIKIGNDKTGLNVKLI